MSTPPFEHLRWFVLGAVVILLSVSYLTVRTLRWRASAHRATLNYPPGRLSTIVLALHLFVILCAGGLLASVHGLPATSDLLIVGGTLGSVYIPPLVLATGMLGWLLYSQHGTAEGPSPSDLSPSEIIAAFIGWNLAIYPSIALLRLFLL